MSLTALFAMACGRNGNGVNADRTQRGEKLMKMSGSFRSYAGVIIPVVICTPVPFKTGAQENHIGGRVTEDAPTKGL